MSTTHHDAPTPAARRPSGPVHRWWRRLRALWRRALEENASPTQFGLAVALGTFISAAPLYGLRTVAAGAVAWLTRLNKLTAVLASHILSGPLAFVAIFYEVRLGCALLERDLPAWGTTNAERFAAAKSAFSAWLVGSAVVAPVCAFVAGAIAYLLARWWRARKDGAGDANEGADEG